MADTFGHLLPSQVRALGDAIKASGLKPEDFVFGFTDAEWAGYLDHVLPTIGYGLHQEFFFKLEHHDPLHDATLGVHDRGGHQVFFAPGREAPTERHAHVSWERVLELFASWLKYVRREVDTSHK